LLIFTGQAVSHCTFDLPIGHPFLTRKQAQIDITDFPVDNKFATELVKAVGIDGLFPQSASSTSLCGRCQQFDFCEPGFNIEDTWADLETSLKTCNFCKMRWEVSQHLREQGISSIRFDRDQSMLKLNEGKIPVISICRSPSELQDTSHKYTIYAS
jgi:hypothetical protein